MKIHNLVQGSPEWLSYRARHFNASDAPAMMGCSPYKTRAQLLRELHTGLTAEVDAGTQRLFDDGHRFEALARPLAEKIIGDDLYPVVGSDGKYSASFDGLTLGSDIAFEHKTLNDELRAIMTGGADGWKLPLHYRVQMEQQCMVSGADRVLFMASRWASDSLEVIEEFHCWYHADSMLRQQIVDGWAQFERDLANYEPPATTAPAAVGKAPDTLPALRIEVTGMVTASNLAEFKQTALTAIQSVNRTLKTDQDFADARKSIAWCQDIETRLKAAKEHALSQTADIDALFKTMDDIGAEARRVRLDLDKVVTKRNVEVKEEAITAARRALDVHIAALNAELAPMTLRPVAADFAGAIKGLRTIASMQDALDVTLANAKIAADAQARLIRANVAHFHKTAQGMELLFSDLSLLVHKSPDDFEAVLAGRIRKQLDLVEAQEKQRQADEAARIAAAEQRAREQEAARIAEQQRQQASIAEPGRIMSEATASAAIADLRSVPAILAQDECRPLSVALATKPDAPMHAREAAAAIKATIEPATLNLGAINSRFKGCIKLDAAGLALMGIERSATDKSASLYRESDIGRICRALVVLCAEVQELQAA